MPISVARSLLPKDTILGVSVNNSEQIRKAVKDGADYVGVGPVWGTKTKNLTSPLLGPRGVAKMLEGLEGTDVKSVAIGEHIRFSNLNPVLTHHLYSRDQIHQHPALFARLGDQEWTSVGWCRCGQRYRGLNGSSCCSTEDCRHSKDVQGLPATRCAQVYCD